MELSSDGTSEAVEPPAPARIISFRGIAAAMMAFAGVVHLLLAVSRTPGWRAEGVGFATVGLLQLLAGAGLVLSASRRWLGAVTVAALVPALVWLYTRTVGYPVGPWEGQTLEIHGLEVLVALAEAGAIAIVLPALLTRPALLGPAGARLDTVGPILIVLAAVPSLVGIEAVDTYLVEPSGRTHTHAP